MPIVNSSRQFGHRPTICRDYRDIFVTADEERWSDCSGYPAIGLVSMPRPGTIPTSRLIGGCPSFQVDWGILFAQLRNRAASVCPISVLPLA